MTSTLVAVILLACVATIMGRPHEEKKNATAKHDQMGPMDEPRVAMSDETWGPDAEGITYRKYPNGDVFGTYPNGEVYQFTFTEYSIGYESLGCYKDSFWGRAISGDMKTFSKETVINSCYSRAQKEGNEYFAVQNGKECFTSSDAGATYNKYGATDGCSDGRGAPWKNSVYRISGYGQTGQSAPKAHRGNIVTGTINAAGQVLNEAGKLVAGFGHGVLHFAGDIANGIGQLGVGVANSIANGVGDAFKFLGDEEKFNTRA